MLPDWSGVIFNLPLLILISEIIFILTENGLGCFDQIITAEMTQFQTSSLLQTCAKKLGSTPRNVIKISLG